MDKNISRINIYAFVQGIFVIMWLTSLVGTDSYFSCYIVCAVLGVLTIYQNYRSLPALSRKCMVCIWAFSIAFSLAVVLANYPLFQPMRSIITLARAGVSFCGGFFIAYNILVYMMNQIPFAFLKGEAAQARQHANRVWGISFLTISVLYLIHFFFVAYPGYFSFDTFMSLKQIRDGAYVNNHPFWFTMLVEACARIGYCLTSDINGALAVYGVFQILFMSACFSYVLVTLYQAGFPKWGIAVVFAAYTFMPYNVALSVNMWKDVMFSISALLMTAALYRIIRGIGVSMALNYSVFAIGGFAFCLMRTNGWYSYLVLALVMLVLLRKNHKLLIFLMCLILLFTWVLLNPVLERLNVGETDMVEALCIPLQQISRVIALGYEVPEEDLELLNRVLYVDQLVDYYAAHLADPIKTNGVRADQKEYLFDNLDVYAKVWLRIGLRYPGEYLKAWIEQTKGFWNGGYERWMYSRGADSAELGIIRPYLDNPLVTVSNIIFELFEYHVVFQPLHSTGLQVWLLFACFAVNIMKRRQEFLLTIPSIVVIVGLWVGTPVFTEFRYAYPLFLSMPMILCATVFHADKIESSHLQ